MNRFYSVVLVMAVALSAAAVAEGLELGPGYADGCTPPSKRELKKLVIVLM
jgi:hypothetical protein